MKTTIKKCLAHAKYIKSPCEIVSRQECSECIYAKNYQKSAKGKLVAKKAYLKKRELILSNIDPVKNRLAAKKFYEKNKDRVLKKRNANTEKTKQYWQKYYQKNKDKIKASRLAKKNKT